MPSITPSLVDTLVTWTEATAGAPTFTHHLPEAYELGFVHDLALRAQHGPYTQQLHTALLGLLPSRPIVVGSTTYPSTERLHAVHIRLAAGAPAPLIEATVIHSYGTSQEFHATYQLTLPAAMQAAFAAWTQTVHVAGYAHYGLPTS